jgi:DNA polymerase-3 subunit epsilon
MGVLGACLMRAGLPVPKFSYCDTVAISRKVWPELENHKLNTVGSFLEIDFKHHNALDDARTCAAIPLKAGEELHTDSLPVLAGRLGINVKPFGVRGGCRR